MEPFPLNAIGVQWEFRCRSKAQGSPWSWHCRSRDGDVVASSSEFFRTLREAVADANKHGFGYGLTKP